MQPRSWHTGRVCVSRVRYSYTRIPPGWPTCSHPPVRDQHWTHLTNHRATRAASISATASDSAHAGRGVSWGGLEMKINRVSEIDDNIHRVFNYFAVCMHAFPWKFLLILHIFSSVKIANMIWQNRKLIFCQTSGQQPGPRGLGEVFWG